MKRKILVIALVIYALFLYNTKEYKFPNTTEAFKYKRVSSDVVNYINTL